MFSTDYPASQPHTTHGLTPPRTGESPPRAPLEAPAPPGCREHAPAPPRASAVARARAAVLGGRARRPPAEHTPMAMHTFTPLDRRVRHRHAIILAPQQYRKSGSLDQRTTEFEIRV